METKYNYIIIGAGIVGLATAINLLKTNSNYKILVLEKESDLGVHQTGNNSGVIHSGIYYKPGSAKAINCKRGYKLLLEFCEKNEIDYKLSGKLIIALNKSEEENLIEIFNRGLENDLSNLEIIEGERIKEIEPYASGTKAIFVPQTGIVDFKSVLKKYAELLNGKNCTIFLNSEVINFIEKTDSVEVFTKNQNYESEFVISCAGLQSDKLAKISNRDLDFKIIPFRGEYYKLSDEKKYLVKTLIYPVPDPSFPFLGVHFTKKINGDVEAGPNAVLAFMREGYNKYSFNSKDSWDTFSWKGFHKIAQSYWKTGIKEFYRSFSKKAFTKELKKLLPKIEAKDLVPGGSGVRAQACDINGNLVDDFKFEKTKRVLHVCNAPSPAATASLAIGERITEIILN